MKSCGPSLFIYYVPSNSEVTAKSHCETRCPLGALLDNSGPLILRGVRTVTVTHLFTAVCVLLAQDPAGRGRLSRLLRMPQCLPVAFRKLLSLTHREYVRVDAHTFSAWGQTVGF